MRASESERERERERERESERDPHMREASKHQAYDTNRLGEDRACQVSLEGLGEEETTAADEPSFWATPGCNCVAFVVQPTTTPVWA